MKFVKRDYWNAEATHRPCRNVVHEFVDGEERRRHADPMNTRPLLDKPHEYDYVDEIKPRERSRE